MTKMGKFKRRRFVLASFQYRLLNVSFVYFVSIVLVFAGFLFIPLILELSNDALSWEERTEAANQFLILHTRLWPAVIVLVILLTLHSILVSHRIAGPLYRFQRVFEAVTGGDLSVRARIRQNDYLEKEADGINRMIEALCNQTRGVKERAEKLQVLVAELKGASANGSLQAIERGVKRMEAQVKQLKLEAGQFRTDTGQGDNRAADFQGPYFERWEEAERHTVTR